MNPEEPEPTSEDSEPTLEGTSQEKSAHPTQESEHTLEEPANTGDSHSVQEPETSPIQHLDYLGLVDNRELQLLDILKEALSSGEFEEIDITVGFLFLSGLVSIQKELEQFFSSDGRMRIVMGSLTSKKTYEQLSMAHLSIEQLKEKHNESLFSKNLLSSAKEEELKKHSHLLKEHVGYSDHTPENEQLYHALRRWLEDTA